MVYSILARVSRSSGTICASFSNTLVSTSLALASVAKLMPVDLLEDGVDEEDKLFF